jgi:hypothetical protein
MLGAVIGGYAWMEPIPMLGTYGRGEVVPMLGAVAAVAAGAAGPQILCFSFVLASIRGRYGVRLVKLVMKGAHHAKANGEQEARIRRLRDQLSGPFGESGVAVRFGTHWPR